MRRAVVLGLLGFLSACSSESSTPNAPPPQGGESGAGAGGDGNSSPEGALHGGVVVTLYGPLAGEDGYTAAVGRFFSGPQPEILALEPRLEQGECTLFVPRAPFCSNPCTPAVCTEDDVCTDYPEPRSVGTLTLNGLGAALSLEPTSSMVVYQSPSLAYPPCELGGGVTASAPGFSLHADCIAPLQLSGPDPIPIRAEQPIHLTWEAAAGGAATRVHIKLDVSHHGGSKGEIDCDVPDSGVFDIPAPLVTELLGLGLAGFPTINLDRVATGVDATNSNLTLVLSSDVTRAVDTGVISCLDTSACPDGQTCQDGGTCG